MSYLQHPLAETDRVAVANSRVHFQSARHHIQHLERVGVQLFSLSYADSCRYGNPEVALNTGVILKEMLRHESLARVLLYSDQ